MTITSIGYDGEVDETQFERLMGYTGAAKYGVNTSAAFRASTVAGQVLQTSLTPGIAWTAGLVDEMHTAETVQLEPVAAGSRWDMIVLRRDYQPEIGNTTLAVVKGTGSKVIPARNINSGVLEDQPLWLVRIDAGKSTPSEYVDLRVFARNGGCTANDDLVRSYMNTLGTQIEINGKLWLRRSGSSGLDEWVLLLEANDSGWVFGARSGAGWTSGGGDYLYSRVRNGMVDVRVRVTRNGPDIPVPATGDIGNVKIGQISSAHAPSFTVAALASSAVGRLASVYVDSTGQVLLAAVSSGGPIRKGDLISASGSYFID